MLLHVVSTLALISLKLYFRAQRLARILGEAASAQPFSPILSATSLQ